MSESKVSCGTVSLQSVTDTDRPTMKPITPTAKVFSCKASNFSIELAKDIHAAAMKTNRIHGRSSTGTPWLFARKLIALKQHNKLFLKWCRHWIKEIYKTESHLIHADRVSEPHIVKYNHKKKMKQKKKGGKAFDGIGTHQDGSYVTIIMSCSRGSEYSGGGTFFPHLSETVRLELGEILLFQGQEGPYSAPHRAQPISGGERLLYLAFFKLKKKKKSSGVVKKKKKIKKKKKKSKPDEGKM